ncbi:MAG: mycothiol conjugate amidase Mca [Nitriliruptorales bacterium]
MSGRRLLFVHAHPDDESSKGAATAARYVDAGARVTLVTCTGGEEGEVLNPSCEAIPPEELPERRRKELAAACAVIGFAARYDLGHRDSGYHEDPSGVPEGTFARLPVDEPSRRLAAVLRVERPQVVVTYPQDGGYPHPDHIMTYEVTMRALELAQDGATDLAGVDLEVAHGAAGAPGQPWRVPKVYACHAFPPRRVLALHGALLERGVDSPFEGWMERRAERRYRDWPCDALLDVGDWFERRDEALRLHETQVDPDGMWFAWPRVVEREVYPWECFTRLRSDVATPEPEEDLFAGLEEEP